MTHQAFPKPTKQPKAKNRTVTKRRQAKRRKYKQTELAAYLAVNKRDGNKCVTCGLDRSGDFLCPSLQLDHHHIVPRSRGGENTTSNICMVCRRCHALIHDKKLIVTGDADKRLVISWR